jgi:RNA polymerase sigma-70 factor, ECF subfamily
MDDGTEAVQTTDTLLLKGLRSGEKGAFEPLFARHWHRVYGVLFRLVGTREEAEDLAQEAFLRLYRNPPSLDGDADLSPWLYRVATNLGYNALRTGGREARRQERAEGYARVDEAVGRDAADPERSAVVAEERQAVRRALTALSEREQACLVLRHSGLSYVAVAAAVGVQASSVGTLLARAEDRFRRAYERLQEVPDGMREDR